MRKKLLLTLVVLMGLTSAMAKNEEQVSNMALGINGGIISFVDANVKALCVANWDTNGDGELDQSEAAAVTDLGEVFKSNSNITSFDELQYFTGLTSIGNYALAHCTGLTSIIIPNSVTSIDTCAFSGCSDLACITIPNSMVSIGFSVFQGCTGLTSITIPNSVTSIGGGAFSDCISLTSITIPNSVTSIYDNVFAGCIGLTSITVESDNTAYDSRDNCNAIIKKATNSLIAGCQSTVIPNSVTSIDNSAFSRCSSLTAITVPNSVTRIGAYAFYECRGLTSISIPNSVKTIDNSAFYECRDLTAITIGNSVDYIGSYAFSDCSGLTSIHIPKSVKNIGSIYGNAFDGCSGLSSITVESGNTAYDSRDNCNAIIEKATNTLIVGCKNTIIPNSVTSIGKRAFTHCSGLTSVTIPNSVTSIGWCAFWDCSGLTSITIPNSVTSIDLVAFADCSSLTDVYCYSEIVPNTHINAFENSPISSAKVHIPNKSIHLYKQSSPWSSFGSFAGLYGSEYTLSYILDGNEYKSYKLWEEEKIFPEAAPTKEGHTFSGWSEIPATMPANDVVITGTFTVNKYKVRYYVYQKLWAEDEVEYGAKLTLRDYTPENTSRYAFAGWDGEKYETMPAKDIEYHAMIITGIGSVNTDANDIKAIFDSTGRKLSKMKRGLNVLKMTDGTTRKVFR